MTRYSYDGHLVPYFMIKKSKFHKIWFEFVKLSFQFSIRLANFLYFKFFDDLDLCGDLDLWPMVMKCRWGHSGYLGNCLAKKWSDYNVTRNRHSCRSTRYRLWPKPSLPIWWPKNLSSTKFGGSFETEIFNFPYVLANFPHFKFFWWPWPFGDFDLWPMVMKCR